jgi:hypothetical protein
VAFSAVLVTPLALLPSARAQPAVPATPRLVSSILDVGAPSARVTGDPGRMRVARTTCPATAPLSPATRQRIVDITVQEWGFFKYGVVDQTIGESEDDPVRGRRGRPRISPEEGGRVAATIAGYWTVTPEGGWILDRQNEAWSSEAGLGARWNSPWSAAFVSWVMCEAGLGDPAMFHRAVAHHRYVDQAIRARDANTRQSAYVAYDAGEAEVLPGDLLCSGRRPAYLTLAERRRQLGEGASTHCDIVVAADVSGRRFLAIGGNVRSVVSLKIMPAEWDARTQRLRPYPFADTTIGDNPYRGARPIFAHLSLRTGSLDADALRRSATVRALACAGLESLPSPLRALVSAVDRLTPEEPQSDPCGSRGGQAQTRPQPRRP